MTTQTTLQRARSKVAAHNLWTCSDCEGTYSTGDDENSYRAARYFARRIAKSEFGAKANCHGLFWRWAADGEGTEWVAYIGTPEAGRDLILQTNRTA